MPTNTTVLLALLLSACITPKPLDSDGDTAAGDEGPTVFDAHDGTVPLDSVVTLEGVVITSPLTRDGEGFFVADPRGGANSGLYIWGGTRFGDLTVTPGDALRITGTLTDFEGWLELVVDSVDDIEVIGELAIPAPVALGDGAGVDWEDYESVAVSLSDQTVTAVNAFNTGTLSAGIQLDDGFQYLDFDCRGAFDALTGIVFYSFGAHSLNPRAADDLGAYTAPVAEPATVAQVQSGEMCGPVILEDVVATSVAADDEGSSVFFVQDAGGGPLSGMGAYVKDALVDIAIGDVLTLTGSADEFYDFTQLYLADATGFEATGAVGEPVAESLSAAPADWEPYEGMLVTLTDVTVTGNESFGEVPTNWNLAIDDLYFGHGLAEGDALAFVTGVVYYSFETWKIEPRSAADLP